MWEPLSLVLVMLEVIPFVFSECFIGVRFYIFNAFKWNESFWIKKAPRWRDFYTQDKLGHFLYKNWAFLHGCLGTLPTLYEQYVVFTCDRERINFMRLFIIFQCIHFGRGRRKAAALILCLISPYRVHQRCSTMYIESEEGETCVPSG